MMYILKPVSTKAYNLETKGYTYQELEINEDQLKILEQLANKYRNFYKYGDTVYEINREKYILELSFMGF